MAGIQSGDVIKKLDDIKISKFSDLKGYLSTKRPDDVVNVTLLRDNDTKIVPVTLIRNQTLQLPIIGLVKNAKEKDLRKLDAQNGVKISSLDKTYERFWKKNGIEEGSIVTAINDKSVNSIDEVKHALENKSSNDPLKFEIINKNGKKESFYWK